VPSVSGRWLLRPPPDDAERLLFAFPYAGVGATSYRQWPRSVGGGWVCALNPPGREHRVRESPHRTHAAFAADLADYLSAYVDRPFAFIGHCGAVPFALETILLLQERGLPAPSRLYASSWGPPHRGLYGELNFVDLESVDLVQEVTRFFERMGTPARPDFAEPFARLLRLDLEIQRSYRYDSSRFLPCPVTAIAWTDDDVVPPDQVQQGWHECCDVTYELLQGPHLAFLGCPPALQELISRGAPIDSPHAPK
jgi:surfactin synthase thioesterase subunit